MFKKSAEDDRRAAKTRLEFEKINRWLSEYPNSEVEKMFSQLEKEGYRLANTPKGPSLRAGQFPPTLFFYPDQFDFEDESRIGWNFSTCPTGTIG